MSVFAITCTSLEYTLMFLVFVCLLLPFGAKVWESLNLWFLFHQSQPHVFSVSTEGASLACYNFFGSSTIRTSTVYGNSVSSQGNQRCSVQCAGVFHCTEAPFQVVNLERKENNFFFLCVSFYGTSGFQPRWWLIFQTAKMEISTLSQDRYRGSRERASQRKSITFSACAKIRRKCFVYFNVDQ